MADVRNDLCLCGKTNLFETKEKAWEYINKQVSKGFTRLVNVHPCRRVAGIWHVTSKPGTSNGKLSALERELHQEMTTVKQLVIEYIKHKYNRSRGTEYKCSVSEIRESLTARSSFTSTPSSISVSVSNLKREGIITELDELDPARKGRGGTPSYLFTLTEILEEVTKPKSNITITQGEEMAEKKVPTQPSKGTPITVAANPFDKVNEQLKLVLTQLQGLATGYSDLVKASSEQTNLTRNVDARYDQLLSLLNSAVTGINREESFSLNAINDLKQEIKQVEVPASAVAEAVNARLSDLRRDDSFIYRVREELDDRIHKTEENIQQHITNMLASIQIPSSVANPNDYREGIKEGIRMAVEMELRSQKW